MQSDELFNAHIGAFCLLQALDRFVCSPMPVLIYAYKKGKVSTKNKNNTIFLLFGGELTQHLLSTLSTYSALLKVLSKKKPNK